MKEPGQVEPSRAWKEWETVVNLFWAIRIPHTKPEFISKWPAWEQEWWSQVMLAMRATSKLLFLELSKSFIRPEFLLNFHERLSKEKKKKRKQLNRIGLAESEIKCWQAQIWFGNPSTTTAYLNGALEILAGKTLSRSLSAEEQPLRRCWWS